MATKSVMVELEGEEEFEIEVDYSYSYDAGCYSGLPENCYPSEEDSEITGPKDLAELVKKFALEVMVPRWIKSIENQIEQMNDDGKPAEWSDEDRQANDEARAADAYDDMMYERKYGRDY